jgi:hypothetical protein
MRIQATTRFMASFTGSRNVARSVPNIHRLSRPDKAGVAGTARAGGAGDRFVGVIGRFRYVEPAVPHLSFPP